MPMAAMPGSLRPGVNDHLLRKWLRVRNNVDTAIRKDPGTQRETRLTVIAGWDGLIAQKPDRFFGQIDARSQALIVEHGSSEDQRIRNLFGTIARRIEQPSAIVVSEAVRRSGLGERPNEIQHFADDWIEFGCNLDVVSGGKQARMQQEIQSVNVIVKRLLKIDAVGPDLACRLLLNCLPAHLLPSRRSVYLRVQRS